jgi:hypothetical protein
MHLDLLQSISLCGDPTIPNDDRAGAGAQRAWVIDGATDLGPPGLLGDRGGAAWLAATAEAAFGTARSDDLAGTCTEVFATIASRYADQRRRGPVAAWELPRASFAAVQVTGDALEVAWAGDCAVLHGHDAGVSWRTPAPDRTRESAAAAAIGAGVGARTLRDAAVLEDRRAARTRGRDVLGVDAAASGAATRYMRCPVAPGDTLLLMSDGFSALVDGYAVYDAAGLMAAAAHDGLASLAVQLRAIERDDATCTRYARFKASDDATALWLRLAG